MWVDTELVTLGLETAISSFSASAGGSGKLLFFFFYLSFHGCPASGKCGEGLRCQQRNTSIQGAVLRRLLGNSSCQCSCSRT